MLQLRRFTSLEFLHRLPTDADITATRAVSSDPQVSPILTTEGWLSTDRLANDGLVIPAQAWDLSEFLKHPSLRFMHETPIGFWFDMKMMPNGVYGACSILDTAAGRDTATLVRGGTCRAYSISWDPMTFEYVRDGDHYRAIYCKAIEGSIVDTPCDVDADIVAVRSFLESNYRKTINFDLGASARRSRSAMTLNTEQIEQRLEAAEVRVTEVQGEKDKLSRALKTAEDKLTEQGRTVAEQTRTIDAMAADILKVQKEMDKKIEEVRASKTITREAAELSDMGVDEIMQMTEGDMKRYLTDSSAEKVRVLQNLNDEACLLAAIKLPGQAASQAARSQFAKTTRAYKRIEKMCAEMGVPLKRAMDTGTAAEGLEWVPAPFSSQFIRDFRLPNPLAGLFPTVRVPGKTLTIPTEGAAQVALYVGEKTTLVSGFVSNEQTPPTGQLVLTPKKYQGRTQISRESVEDIIVALLPYVSSSVQASIDLAWEYALLTSQASGTHMDTNVTASTDARKSINGLRYFADSIRSTDAIAGGTFNVGLIQNCRAKMGKYGITPSDLALICSIKAYLTRLLNKTEMEEVFTLDKYGAGAVVVTGELAKVLGIPVVVSGVYPDNLNAIGKYDGSTTDRTSMLVVNRRMFIQGIRRDIEVFTEFDARNDVYDLIAYARMDFQPVLTPTTATACIVNSIIDVATV